MPLTTPDLLNTHRLTPVPTWRGDIGNTLAHLREVLLDSPSNAEFRTGVVTLGTTGDGHNYNGGEILNFYRDSSLGQLIKGFPEHVFVAGLGDPATHDGKLRAIIKAAAEAGFHTVLALPGTDESKQRDYHRELFDQCGEYCLKAMLYNIPRLHHKVSIALFAWLATEKPEILLGIKDSAPKCAMLPEYMVESDALCLTHELLWGIGDDEYILRLTECYPRLNLAAISGLSNLPRIRKAVDTIMLGKSGLEDAHADIVTCAGHFQGKNFSQELRAILEGEYGW